MNINNQVSINVEKIQEIINEIKEISSLCSTPHLKSKVEKLQKNVSGLLEFQKKVSVEELIYEKMVKVKQNNPELHLKLYMLYRNLNNGRISEVDAMSSFESYLSMFATDVMVF
jgi:hypothetical protein